MSANGNERGDTLPKYIVDFELSGDIEVQARNRNEAIIQVEEMTTAQLVSKVQNMNAGRNYCDRRD